MTKTLLATVSGLAMLVSDAINGAAGAPSPKATSPINTALLAVVALKEQRITIYAGDGKIMQAPISTGRSGYETPAGVFSILEKRREHRSNLYDDASMPFMQRLTWSGIALHAGPLPGHPASHGCIRLPYSFARQLFDVTRVAMRIVVVPTDISPVGVRHPSLFQPGPIVSEPMVATITVGDDDPMRLGAAPTDAVSVRRRTWRAIATEKAAEAELATKIAAEAKMVAAKSASESAEAARQLRKAESMLASAERRLKAANRSLEEAKSERATERAEQEKAKALELVAESERRVEAVKAEAEPKSKAAGATHAAAEAANAARAATHEAAKLAEAKLAPVSVLISRKTQRLYVRQAFQPMFDAPVTVRDAHQPIGTTIFTAMQSANDDGDLRWAVLAMRKPERLSSRNKRGDEKVATNGEAAKAALERISIPVEVRQRINEVASPGASLIISDEAMHPRETGKGTDFIVVMSEEPQGGLTIRPRSANRDRERSYRHRRSVRSSGGIIE